MQIRGVFRLHHGFLRSFISHMGTDLSSVRQFSTLLRGVCRPDRFLTIIGVDNDIPIILNNEKGSRMAARSGGPARVTMQIQNKVSIVLHDEFGHIVF